MSMKFHNFSFPNKKVKPEFENPSKFGQKGSHQICKAIDDRMRGKGHFLGESVHTLAAFESRLIHQQPFCQNQFLMLSQNFRHFLPKHFGGESVSEDVKF